MSWMLLCVLAAAAGRGAAAADSVNFTSLVNDTGTVPAYLDWELGIILSTPYEYMGDRDFRAGTATSWQQFYELKSKYQAQELAGSSVTRLGNTTLAVEVAGNIDKWRYKSTTSCATIVSKPGNSYIDAGLVGTGLVPITCGLLDEAQPATAGNVLCNAIYRHSTAELFPAGQIDPLHTLDNASAGPSLDVANFMTPMSRGDLLLSGADQFDWLTLDSSSFITSDPSVEFMTREPVKVSMSAYKGMGGLHECARNLWPLVLPLPGLLLSGTIFYCFEAQDDIMVVTWNLTNFATPIDCGQIRDRRRFMLILYGGTKLQTAGDTFQYMYTVTEDADGQWDVTCTTKWYQSTNPSAELNENWDRLYFTEAAVLLAFWPRISSCAVGDWGPVNGILGGLIYNIAITGSEQVGRDLDDAGNLVSYYPHFSPQSMYPLLDGMNGSQMLRLTSSNSGTCVLKPEQGSPTVLGDGSANLAKESISSLLALGIASGYGGEHLPVIRQQINDMSADFSSTTVAGAVNAAMTSIIGAYSANVFTLKIKFLKATSVMRLTIRTLVSVVEAAVAGVTILTAMWALYSKGKACKTMQWVDSKMGTPCDYEVCDHYISTNATICGSADYWVEQWVVLSVGLLLAIMLIMYRWHFARGGSVSDWVEVETDQQHAAQTGDNKV